MTPNKRNKTLHTSVSSDLSNAPDLPQALSAVAAPKLLDQARARLRVKRTEGAYLGWIRRFILSHNNRNPREMGKVEVESCLSDLAPGLTNAATPLQA
jgi:hypothetical protein